MILKLLHFFLLLLAITFCYNVNRNFGISISLSHCPLLVTGVLFCKFSNSMVTSMKSQIFFQLFFPVTFLCFCFGLFCPKKLNSSCLFCCCFLLCLHLFGEQHQLYKLFNWPMLILSISVRFLDRVIWYVALGPNTHRNSYYILFYFASIPFRKYVNLWTIVRHRYCLFLSYIDWIFPANFLGWHLIFLQDIVIAFFCHFSSFFCGYFININLLWETFLFERLLFAQCNGHGWETRFPVQRNFSISFNKNFSLKQLQQDAVYICQISNQSFTRFTISAFSGEN